MHEPRLLDHALFVAVGVLLPLQGLLLLGRRGQDPPALEPREKIAMYWLNSAVLGALSLAVAWVWLRAGSDLGALGLGLRAREGTRWWLLALVLALYVLDAAWKLAPARRAATARRMRRDVPFLPADRRELLHSAALVAGSAVFEEVLYRGFVMAYLAAALDLSPAAVVLVPAALFALGHVYQGAADAAKVALLAALFGWFYLGSGVLWPLFLVHAAIDAAGMLIAVRLARVRL